jgi:hypothetical protein
MNDLFPTPQSILSDKDRFISASEREIDYEEIANRLGAGDDDAAAGGESADLRNLVHRWLDAVGNRLAARD